MNPDEAAQWADRSGGSEGYIAYALLQWQRIEYVLAHGKPLGLEQRIYLRKVAALVRDGHKDPLGIAKKAGGRPARGMAAKATARRVHDLVCAGAKVKDAVDAVELGLKTTATKNGSVTRTYYQFVDELLAEDAMRESLEAGRRGRGVESGPIFEAAAARNRRRS